MNRSATLSIDEQEFDLSTQIVELRLRHPFKISRGTKEIVPNLFVTLHAKGITGFGEAGPNARYGESAERVQAVIEALARSSTHLREGEFTGRLKEMADKLDLPEQRSAALALETAWLDWKAKEVSQSLRAYLSIPETITRPSSYTIGLDTPEKMQSKLEDRPDAQVLKIKLGLSLEEDKQIIRQIRERTDVPIRVDANEGWTELQTAIEMVEFLTEQGIELIEQPMPSSLDHLMPELKAVSPLPLIADESLSVTGSLDLDVLAERFDGINIKLMKIGSLLDSIQLLKEAQAKGLHVMTGCMIESSLGIAAGALVGLQADFVDLDGHLLISNDPIGGLTTFSDGRIELNEQPGMGVEWV